MTLMIGRQIIMNCRYLERKRSWPNLHIYQHLLRGTVENYEKPESEQPMYRLSTWKLPNTRLELYSYSNSLDENFCLFGISSRIAVPLHATALVWTLRLKPVPYVAHLHETSARRNSRVSVRK
jgi:hypothetical protein